MLYFGLSYLPEQPLSRQKNAAKKPRFLQTSSMHKVRTGAKPQEAVQIIWLLGSAFTQLHQNAIGGLGMQKGDLGTPGPRARRLVDQLDAF